jgi:azurin
MKDIHALPDGLEIEFTLPVDASKLKNAMSYTVNSFTYKYHHNYGSPIINNRERKIIGIVPSSDGRKVKLVLDSLMEGYIHEVRVKDLVSTNQRTLLHDFAYYTMNNIPEGEKTMLNADQKVSMHAGMNHDMKNMPAPNPSAPTKKRQTSMPKDWTQPDRVLKLGTKPGLKFDVTNFEVKAGSKVRLIFNNNDDMTHNVVIVAPGAADEVGNLALNLGLKGSEMSYVPNSSKVLFHTALIGPDATESIYFVAPTTPGEYSFICSFPGHASVMRGIIKVVP